MKFRFHISKSIRPDQPLPPLSEWGSAPLGLTGTPLPWTLGATPSRVITGASSLSPKTTEYLYVEHPFISGRSYQLSFGITHVDDTGFPQNPRTLTITIQDQSNSILVTQSYSTVAGLNDVVFNFTAGIGYSRIGIRFNSGSARTMTAESVAVSVTQYEFHEAYINEPDGWRDSTLKLERDKLFHSLIEHFEGSFIFYGNNGRINGGYHYLKNWDAQDGPDADISLVIEYSDNNVDFYEIFTGQLDMSLAEWMIDHKVRIPIIKDNFWATFMNRKETPVNLIATEDLDDVEVEELIDDISIDLPSQKIRYIGEYNWLDTFTYYEDVGIDFAIAAQLDWDETLVDDLRKFNLPRALINIGDNPIWNVLTGVFEAPWDGEYTFDVRIESAYYDTVNDLWLPSASSAVAPAFRIAVVGSTITETGGFGSADLSTVLSNTDVVYGSDEITVSTYTKTLTLFKGQQVAIWGRPGVGVPVDHPENLTVFGERRLTWSDVRLATTGTIVLSGEQTIDGVTTSADRVLVKNQGDPSQNGIYVSSAGAWTRATDVDSSVDLINAAAYVTEGDTNIDTGWRQAADEVDIGVTSNNWVYIIPNDERLRPYPGGEVDNHFNVTADTTFRKTRTTGFLIHDTGAAILKHLGLGQVNPFYSEVMGSDRTLARQYVENGCFWPYGLTRGLQLRGYSMAEKSFAMSFMEWWQGADPIFNLGLGYEYTPGSVRDPGVIDVADMDDWENAAGGNPGTWTYTSPATPHISVNGSGGVSGYTKGDCITDAGVLYAFSFCLYIYDTGSSGEITTVRVAILDASDNEIEATDFNYTDAGFKHENFNFTPSTAGAFVALSITNDTPIDTKTYVLYYFAGATNQFLLDPDFSTGLPWDHDASGSPWIATGFTMDLMLPSGVSELLSQTFAGGSAGKYLMMFQRTTTGFNIPTDSVNYSIRVYDAANNVITGSAEFMVTNDSQDGAFAFETVVPITKISVIAEINSGADINITMDFLRLIGPVAVGSIVIDPETRIRVEKREYFYDPEPVVFLSNIRDITRRYDTEKIYKKILIGYKTWKTEDISGIDDPQTKHTYATQLKKTGEEIEVLSEFIAASLAIEQARRQSIDKSTDYQFDDSTFIIALNTEDVSVSPDSFVPETDENFTVINNLLNSETRYNIRLTPKRSFLRHLNWFNIGLQSYVGSLYRFTRGEGNYDVETAMLSTCDEEDYGGELLGEGYNLTVTNDAIHSAYYYEIGYKLGLSEYRQMAANKNKAIGVSQTDFNHIAFFIDSLAYQMAKGEVKISGWTKEYWDITSILGLPPTQDCTLFIPCENPITDDLFNELADEEGNCIVWTL